MVICISFWVGLNGAIDTWVSQAFGEKEYYLCGCYLNRGRIIQAVLFIPQALLFFLTKPLLLYLEQEEASADVAQTYIITMLPGLFALTQFETVRRYLQGMGIFACTMYIQFATIIIHIVLWYLLIYRADLGVVGASISAWITYFLNLIVVTLYVTFRNGIVPKESWHFFNFDSFRSLSEFAKYGLTSSLIICLEWWCFYILSMLAGSMGVEQLAAYVILLNISFLLFQIPQGIGFVLSDLVGNSLGEKNLIKTKRYLISSYIVNFITVIVLIIILLIFKRKISKFFTEEVEVDEFIIHCIPAFCAWMFFDFTQGVIWGALRGVGYQTYGAVVSFVAFWGITIPLADLIAFVYDFKLAGLWAAVAIGSSFSAFAYSWIIWTANWSKLTIKIARRIENDKNGLSSHLLELKQE